MGGWGDGIHHRQNHHLQASRSVVRGQPCQMRHELYDTSRIHEERLPGRARIGVVGRVIHHVAHAVGERSERLHRVAGVVRSQAAACINPVAGVEHRAVHRTVGIGDTIAISSAVECADRGDRRDHDGAEHPPVTVGILSHLPGRREIEAHTALRDLIRNACRAIPEGCSPREAISESQAAHQARPMMLLAVVPA